MSESRIDILIEARNKASGEVNKLNKELGQLGASASKGTGRLSADFDELRNRVLGTNEAFGLLSKGAVAVGVAVATIKLGQLAFEMGRASAGSLALANEFDKLATQAGSSGDAMLAAMRKASRGMVDDTTLIAAANRAMLLGVASDAEGMAKLIEVASARGRAMGLSTAQAFNDIVTGIGRMSPMILDNLGITVDAAKANDEYARSLGRTAEQLTDNEKKQALLNAVVQSSASLLAENAAQGQDLAGSFQRMDASISNAKDSLGALFTPYAAKVAEAIAEATDKATAAMLAQADTAGRLKSRLEELQGMSSAMRTLADLSLPVSSAPLQEQQDALPAIIELWGKMERAVAANVAGSERYKGELDSIATAAATGALSQDQISRIGMIAEWWDLVAVGVVYAAEQQKAAADGLAEGTSNAAGEAEKLAANLAIAEQLGKSASDTLKTSFSGIIDTVGIGEALRRYEQANFVLQEQIGLWRAAGIEGEALAFHIASFVQNIQEGNSALNGTIGQLSEVERIAASAAAQIKSSFLGMAQLAGASQSFQQYRQATEELGVQVQIWEQMGLSSEEIEFNTAKFVQGIQSANSELRTTLTSTGSIPKYVKDAEKAFDSLKSKISGVLSGALQSGIDLDSILPRQDAVEEDARRLADIAVNGYKSPWVKYFQEKFPQLFAELGTGGDIKGAAARILRDFEDGLRPELLNKETVKDRVRRMLLGEGNLEGLAAEIAAELSAEFGGQFSQADILGKAQEALGATGATANIQAKIAIPSTSAADVVSQLQTQIDSGESSTRLSATGASMVTKLFDGAKAALTALSSTLVGDMTTQLDGAIANLDLRTSATATVDVMPTLVLSTDSADFMGQVVSGLGDLSTTVQAQINVIPAISVDGRNLDLSQKILDGIDNEAAAERMTAASQSLVEQFFNSAVDVVERIDNADQIGESLVEQLFGRAVDAAERIDLASQIAESLSTQPAINLDMEFTVNRNVASNVLGQIEGQFTDEKAIKKAQAIGSSFMSQFFNGAFDTAETLPFWDKLLAIIIRQRVTAGA